MCNRDSLQTKAQPLPTNRFVLEDLFKRCSACYEAADVALHRNRQSARNLFEFVDRAITLETLQSRQHQIDSHFQSDRTDRSPNCDDLWQYCLPEAVRDMNELGTLGAAVTQPVAADASEADLSAHAARIAHWLAALKLRASLLALLRGQLAERLERADVPVSADTVADAAKKIAGIEPRNSDILLLYARIERERQLRSSDFTEGNVKRAESLLRGVRRYRQSLAKLAREESSADTPS